MRPVLLGQGEPGTLQYISVCIVIVTGLAYRWNFTDNRYADIDLSFPIYRPEVSVDILAFIGITAYR